MKRALFSVVFYLAFVSGDGYTSSPQKPSFEVATIKQNMSLAGGGNLATRGDRFLATNIPLSGLVNEAFTPPNARLFSQQIVGLPDWAKTDRFDIEANLGETAAATPPAQVRLMLQTLLEDRFHLKVHWDKREVSVYNLVLAKGGLKMKPSEDQTPPSGGFVNYDPTGQQAGPLPRGSLRISGTSEVRITGNAAPISRIVSLLQGQSDRIALDKTNLTGFFDIDLQFSSDSATMSAGSAGAMLFTAIQDLGLRLEPGKEAMDVLIIDSIQKLQQ